MTVADSDSRDWACIFVMNRAVFAEEIMTGDLCLYT